MLWSAPCGTWAMDLNHLHLHVRSLEASKAFYERFFGMREFVRHGEIVFMRDGAGMDLALAPADQVEPLPAWFHFGFRLDSPDAVQDLRRALQQAGVPMKGPLEVEPDLVSFRCADPDGYTIEVYWEPQPA